MKKFGLLVLLSILIYAGISPADTDPNYLIVLKLQYSSNQYGDLLIELDPTNAPISSENFRRYVEEGFYEGLIFHRSDNNESFSIIQGGGYDINFDDPNTHDPIVLESDNGLSNVRGTIAMARTNVADSATSQIFFNQRDNSGVFDYIPSSRDGYAVFGNVIKGMEIVDAIALGAVEDANGLQNVPVIRPVIRQAGYQHEIGYCAEYKPADFNHDCVIDSGDLAYMATNWLGEDYKNIDTGWDNLWDGPSIDTFKDMTTDSENNCIITAQTRQPSGNRDYVTVKYDPSGVILWEKTYDGAASSFDSPEAVVVDADDNVIVTGYAEQGSRDFTTVKYAPDGTKLWQANYNGPDQSYDWAYDTAVDDSNNIFVVGKTLTGSSGYDYAIVKYNPDGIELWSETGTGSRPGSHDFFTAVAADPNGNVIAVGNIENTGTGYDILIAKYDPDGNEVWAIPYWAAQGSYNDLANDVAVHQNGDVFVAASSGNDSGDTDFTVLKLSPAGDNNWPATYNGTGLSFDAANALALDSSGNVYAAGVIYDEITSGNIGIIKYDPSGKQLWLARYDGPASGLDIAYDIAVSPDDQYIYVAGKITNSNGDYDFVTLKYSTDGEFISAIQYDHNGGDDEASAVAVAPDGTVYTAGTAADTTDAVAALQYTEKDFGKYSTAGDANADNKVDFDDLAAGAKTWLDCGLEPAQACGD